MQVCSAQYAVELQTHQTHSTCAETCLCLSKLKALYERIVSPYYLSVKSYMSSHHCVAGTCILCMAL